MPFGKPKKGAGSAAQRDDGMIQPVLDLLQKNRVHDLPPDDSPATRERFKATYEEAYSMLQTMRHCSGDSNAGACRSADLQLSCFVRVFVCRVCSEAIMPIAGHLCDACVFVAVWCAGCRPRCYSTHGSLLQSRYRAC